MGGQETTKLALEVKIEYLGEDSGILSSAIYCTSVLTLRWCGGTSSCLKATLPVCVREAQKTIAPCCAIEWVVMDEAAVNSSWRAAVF